MVLVVILGVVPGVADQADYLGTWVNTMEHATKDGVTVMVFVLAEEGVCYFSTQSFDKVKGEPGLGRDYIGFWYELNGGVYIKYGNYADDEFILEGSQLRARTTRELFTRVGGGPLPEGAIRVPVGTFTAGEDFPAGRYTVTVGEDVRLAIVEVYENAEDTIGDSYWLGTSNGGTTAVLTFPEGSILSLSNHGVVLTPFTGLSN